MAERLCRVLDHNGDGGNAPAPLQVAGSDRDVCAGHLADNSNRRRDRHIQVREGQAHGGAALEVSVSTSNGNNIYCSLVPSSASRLPLQPHISIDTLLLLLFGMYVFFFILSSTTENAARFSGTDWIISLASTK